MLILMAVRISRGLFFLARPGSFFQIDVVMWMSTHFLDQATHFLYTATKANSRELCQVASQDQTRYTQ
jgi:hypothetical protein